MKDFIPNICGTNDVYIPQEGCDECDKLLKRIEDVEEKNIEQDNRLDAIDECCIKVKNTLVEHETQIIDNSTNIQNINSQIQIINAEIESVDNKFSNYYTKEETYTQAQVDELISQIETSSYIEVDELPEVGQGNVIYLVPKPTGGYERWIYSNGEWKNLGDDNIDLSDYVRVDEVIDMIHPVGDTIIRTDNTNPASLYTGTTWKKISEGRMLLGANSTYTLGSTGGEATHKLTVAEMPSHTHTQNSHNHTQNPHNHNVAVNETFHPAGGGGVATAWAVDIYNGGKVNGALATTATNKATTATNNNTGGGNAHNNMPPYIAVNIWIRTA